MYIPDLDLSYMPAKLLNISIPFRVPFSSLDIQSGCG
jgi:hypothetical protein